MQNDKGIKKEAMLDSNCLGPLPLVIIPQIYKKQNINCNMQNGIIKAMWKKPFALVNSLMTPNSTSMT